MTSKHRMYPADRRVSPKKRKQAKPKTEPMPLRWMLLIPVVVLAGLWAGYHFTHPGDGGTAASTPIRDATYVGGGSDAGGSHAASDADISHTSPAPSDTSASGDDEPPRGGRIFIM